VKFHPKGLDAEIESTMWRNKAIKKYFKFGLYEKLCPELEDKLSNAKHYNEEITKKPFDLEDYTK
jgi:hypothetical protein